MMRRLFFTALCACFLFGFSVSAHAVNITIQENYTANNIFGFTGVSQVTDKNIINSLITDQSTRYDVHLLGGSSQFTNKLAYWNSNGELLAFDSSYNPDNINPATGLYNGNSLIASDFLVPDLGIYAYYNNGTFDFHDLRSVNAIINYDTNVYNAPAQGPSGHGSGMFQLYIVTENSVEINGRSYSKDSLIFCYDDGGYLHTDFNDLVFVMSSKNPPVVPIPGAVFLLAPGVAGIAALRRKMK